MARTLTSANSIFMLSIEGLYDTPIRLQGYSAESMFSFEGTAPNQTSMGIDGRLSGGFVHVPKVMSFTLQADSLSNDIIERWNAAMEQRREIMLANGIVSLPATNRKYTLTRGFLTNYTPVPSAAQNLSPREFSITWETVAPATML